MATKSTKITGSDHPTVVCVWGTLAMKPPQISTRALYHLKVVPGLYSCHGWCGSIFFQNFCVELRKTHHLCSRVWYNHSRSSKVIDVGVNWKGLWDFLLVINSNLVPICHHFWDTATYWSKITNFLYIPIPYLVYHPRSGWSLSNFWKSFIDTETKGEDLMILACTVLTESQSVTDRQMDAFAIAKTGHAAIVMLCKNCQWRQSAGLHSTYTLHRIQLFYFFPKLT